MLGERKKTRQESGGTRERRENRESPRRDGREERKWEGKRMGERELCK